MPDSSDGPTVLRILLGSQLRRLREVRGITARQAASKIRASESKISRIELGRNAIREIDVLDLLTLYGVAPAEREELARLRRENHRLRQERDILAKAAAWFARESKASPNGFTGS